MDIERGSQNGRRNGRCAWAVLTVSDLAVARGERRLFERLSFRLKPGEALALTGANGAGKTSLLRAVAGLIRPEAGTVDYDGASLSERRDLLHLMGHLDGLKGGRFARDELAFQARWSGADEDGIARAVERLRLAPLLDLECRRLSAGQRRRLAFARLVAAPRPLWLLDEPLAPLDADWREGLSVLMAEHLAGGGLILAAVHDPLPVAAGVLDVGGAA